MNIEEIKQARYYLLNDDFYRALGIISRYFKFRSCPVPCEVAQLWHRVMDAENKAEQLREVHEYINFSETILIHSHWLGRTIDYTKMKDGDFLEDGALVTICPKCNRPGLVDMGDPKYYHSTTHKIKYSSPRCAKILVTCHLNTGADWSELVYLKEDC